MHQRHACCALLAITLLAAALTAASAAERTLVVAADGSGDFTSIQAALDTIPQDNRERIVIQVRNGVYYEKVLIDQNRVTLRGESRDGVRIRFNLPRPEYDKRYDRIGPAVLNVFGSDVIVEYLTVENTQPTQHHAFAIYGQPNRLILDGCDVLSNGGDTLSLWNTSYGMYYHRNCRFRGSVDFVCPRGWCYVRDSQFEELSTSAGLWQDGHMDLDMKFVMQDCTFDGAENFWLGRNHYPSQFYLIDCTFSENMADRPIGTVIDLRRVADKTVYERKYFYNCHRDGGDYPWHADNLQSAPGAPTPDQITPAWTFGGKWDPESTAPPTIESVELSDDLVYVYFSEDVAGFQRAQVVRQDGTWAALVDGKGTRCLAFQGGNAQSTPVRLDLNDDQPYGTVATLATRYVPGQSLPTASQRKEITILLIGDSTVASYKTDSDKQGWGWALGDFFDDRVTVVNRARGGRSSKSFRAEGHWDAAHGIDADYVFIQFGHNDNPGKGPDRETDHSPGGDFRSNLRQYVEDVRAAGAVPILVSPPTRREFTERGTIDTNERNVPYAQAVLAVAEAANCAVVDLNTLSRNLFDRLGRTTSDWLQPEGDRTHFTPAGAHRIAATVLTDLQERVPALRPYVEQDALTRY